MTAGIIQFILAIGTIFSVFTAVWHLFIQSQGAAHTCCCTHFRDGMILLFHEVRDIIEGFTSSYIGLNKLCAPYRLAIGAVLLLGLIWGTSTNTI